MMEPEQAQGWVGRVSGEPGWVSTLLRSGLLCLLLSTSAWAVCDPTALPTTLSGGVGLQTWAHNQCNWDVTHNSNAVLLNNFTKAIGTGTPAANSVCTDGQACSMDNSWFNVMDPTYGAMGDGSTDDTAALNAAGVACDANARDGTVYFPPGTYKTTSTVTFTNCRVKGAGMVNSVIAPTTAVAGTPAVILAAPGNGGGLHQGGMADMQITGPSAAPAYGAHPSSLVDCLRLDASTLLERVRVTNCDKGITTNAQTGHQYLTSVEASNNYYGIFMAHQADNTDGQGDVFLNCNLSNSFANVAVPTNTQIGALTGIGGTWGLTPYGIWQEGASTGAFLGTLTLNNVYFEGMGNAAIASANIPSGGTGGLATNIFIFNPGYSYSAGANLATASCLPGTGNPYQCCTGAGAGCSKAYGIQVGTMAGNFYEWTGSSPIDMSTAGGTGVMSTTQCQGSVSIDRQGAMGPVSCGTNQAFVRISDGHGGWTWNGYDPTDSPVTCASGSRGKTYYDLSLEKLCYCDGTQAKWCQVGRTNTECTGSTAPFACCIGAGTGTCCNTNASCG